MTLDKIKPYAKAVMAGAVAAAGAIATGYADEVLSNGEIAMAVSAGLTAFGATWVIPNAAKARKVATPGAPGDSFEAHDANGGEDYQQPIVRHDP